MLIKITSSLFCNNTIQDWQQLPVLGNNFEVLHSSGKCHKRNTLDVSGHQQLRENDSSGSFYSLIIDVVLTISVLLYI